MQHARKDYQEVISNGTRRIIPDDEPVFLIRGQDIVGGAAVRAWADLAEKAGADAQIVGLARQHADKMDAWPKKKVPDLPKQISADLDSEAGDEEIEPVDHCESCGKPLYEGDLAHCGAEGVKLCVEHAPSYGDLLRHPDHFGDPDDERTSPQEAQGIVDAHLAAGGSLDDKIVSVL